SRALPAGEAVEFATGLDDPHARALALAALADVLGGYNWDGQVAPATRAADRALWAAQGVVDPDGRAADVATVVDVAARAGLVGPALAAAGSIPESMAARRSEALGSIAFVESERAHDDRALEISAPCTPADRLRVFANILAVSSTEPSVRRFGRTKAARR
ncbi:MAG: hypothetical protein LC745_08405, partial [Planctomycetia bacterium]|nr:hypothetical protein [Planctomycetia bacterium]